MNNEWRLLRMAANERVVIPPVSAGGVAYAIVWSPELSMFVAVGARSFSSKYTYTAYSYDGITWSLSYLPAVATCREVIWVEQRGLFITRDANTNTIFTSDDGIKWNKITYTVTGAGASVGGSGIAYSATTDTFVATCGQIQCMYGTNLTNWTVAGQTSSTTNVSYAEWSPTLNIFAAAGSGTIGTAVIASAPGTGTPWTYKVTTEQGRGGYSDVLYVPEWSSFVAVGSAWRSAQFTGFPNLAGPLWAWSADGVTWSKSNAVGAVGTDTSTPPHGQMAYSATLNRVIAAGQRWATMTSPSSYTQVSVPPFLGTWMSIAWSPELNLFVSGSTSTSGSAFMSSTNGTTWTARSIS